MTLKFVTKENTNIQVNSTKNIMPDFKIQLPVFMTVIIVKVLRMTIHRIKYVHMCKSYKVTLYIYAKSFGFRRVINMLDVGNPLSICHQIVKSLIAINPYMILPVHADVGNFKCCLVPERQ